MFLLMFRLHKYYLNNRQLFDEKKKKDNELLTALEIRRISRHCVEQWQATRRIDRPLYPGESDFRNNDYGVKVEKINGKVGDPEWN